MSLNDTKLKLSVTYLIPASKSVMSLGMNSPIKGSSIMFWSVVNVKNIDWSSSLSYNEMIKDQTMIMKLHIKSANISLLISSDTLRLCHLFE